MAFAAAQPFPGWQKVLPGHGHNPRVTSWAELCAAPTRHLQLAFIIGAELPGDKLQGILHSPGEREMEDIYCSASHGHRLQVYN